MGQTSVTAKNLQEGDVGVTFNGAPDECPICHLKINPKRWLPIIHKNRFQMVNQCTSQDCGRVFLATYSRGLQGIFDYHKSEPVEFVRHDFGAEIQGLSPVFCEVYNQALAGEAAGLSQLVGIGLRKSIEFLVKDYAQIRYPEKADEIKKSTLAQCINNFCQDPNVKKCAERATWLGNDETHYVRKWEDKDIRDLKILVRLLVNWIENYLLTEKYEREMQKKS